MKYLSLHEIDEVTDALNFETADCRIVGACDIYITKAAGGDKKLYKNIETSLETQYEAAVRFSASLSPPEAEHAANELNLSRSSPFGPLSQISSRRTFAYLIATLNASHPDYDFSQFLRPSDFRKERRLKRVMDAIDTTLFALRPKSLANALSAGKFAMGTSPLPEDELATPKAETVPSNSSWNPKMWEAIDKEMSLEDCTLYSYEPEDDPYDDDEDEPAIWSFHYFFFNKAKKRVCYLHLRALSLSSDADGFRTPMTPTPVAAGRTIDLSWARAEPGSAKRAKYWLGDRAIGNVIGGWDDEDETGEDSDHRGLTDNEASKYDSELSESPSPYLGRKRSNLDTIREAGLGVDDDIAEAIEL